MNILGIKIERFNNEGHFRMRMYGAKGISGSIKILKIGKNYKYLIYI